MRRVAVGAPNAAEPRWPCVVPDAKPADGSVATRDPGPTSRACLLDHRRGERRRYGGRLRAPQRKPHGETAAAPDVAFDVDATGVLAHDRVRDREAKPGPLPRQPRGEEWLEDSRQVPRTDPASSVLDLHPRLGFGRAGRDPDRPVTLDRLRRVDDQIVEHLRQPRG